MSYRWPLAVAVPLVTALVWPLSERAASPRVGNDTIRVATFNIHKGATRDGEYVLERTIEAIIRLNADVIGLQEVMLAHPQLNCDDQTALIAGALRRRTGRPWSSVYVPAVPTDRRDCMRMGRGTEPETEGLAMLSPYPILQSHWVRLSEIRAAVAVRIASMPGTAIVMTHLSANADNQALRIREIETMLPWASRVGAGVLMGDLNARPYAPELAPVQAVYRDAWWDASLVGRIGGVLSGSTRPGRNVARIDYVYYAPATLTIDSADVLDAGAMPGVGEVSDHNPVAVTFRQRHID